MLIIHRRKKLSIKMETVYFAGDYSTYKTDCDVVLFYSTRVAPRGLHHGTSSYTIHIGMEDDEDTLLGNMSKSTRHDIRKALALPGITPVIHRHPTMDEVNGFTDHYNCFASQLGIDKVDMNFVRELQEHGWLSLIDVMDEKGKVLCGAMDIVDQERCYGVYAFTTFREDAEKRLAGQANKLLYWVSMREGKRAGCRFMDLAGISLGMRRTDLNGIDAFKRSFGGNAVLEYHFYYPYTWKGMLLVLLFKLLKKDFGATFSKRDTKAR